MRKTIPDLKLWTYHLASLLIGFAILALLIYFAGYKRLLNVLLHASIGWIAISVLVYAASWIFRVWRLERFTTQSGTYIKLFELFKLYISGFALNIILPAKLGDAATIGYLRLQGINVGWAAAIIFQTRILDLLTLLLLCIPALFLLFANGIPGWISMSLSFCLIVALIPFVMVFMDKRHLLAAGLEGLEKRVSRRFLIVFLSKVKDAYLSYRQIISNKKLTVVSSLLSIMIWLLEALSCYLLALAINAEIQLNAVLFAVCLSNLAKVIPATPGSVGIYESILTTILVMLGVPFDVALALSILDHAIKKIFNLSFGLPATASIGFKVSNLVELYRQKACTRPQEQFDRIS